MDSSSLSHKLHFSSLRSVPGLLGISRTFCTGEGSGDAIFKPALLRDGSRPLTAQISSPVPTSVLDEKFKASRRLARGDARERVRGRDETTWKGELVQSAELQNSLSERIQARLIHGGSRPLRRASLKILMFSLKARLNVAHAAARFSKGFGWIRLWRARGRKSEFFGGVCKVIFRAVLFSWLEFSNFGTPFFRLFRFVEWKVSYKVLENVYSFIYRE